MEFSKKLQELRKQKGLTQEQLANKLFVSRTAISKWESGKGYPSIDSLKQIATLFSVTVDQLLSNEELLTLAEENTKQTKNCFRDLIFGLLDVCASLLLFLPFFAQRSGEVISEVSLLKLSQVAPFLKVIYFVIIFSTVLWGVLTLALQNFSDDLWIKIKISTSLSINVLGVAIFIISLQPYAAIFLFIFLIIKVLIVTKNNVTKSVITLR